MATVSSTTSDPLLVNNTSAVAAAPAIAAASADLSITKTAVEPSVTPGLTFSYAIAVSNAGPSDATNVVVTDSLPTGLTFVSSTGACTAVGQDVTCPMVATLASGGSTSITLTVRLDPAYTGDGSDLDNIAVVSSDTADPDPSNNTSAAATAPAVTAPSADVRIVKSVSADPLVAGQNFTYTLTVTNAGPSVATGVAVTDTLPMQTTFVSSTQGCTAVGQSVTCPTLATLGVGAGATFTIVVQLDPAYTGDGTDVLNSSIVSAATSDPAMANNTSPAGAPPVGPGQADLAITKDVSTTPVTPGNNFEFTLRVTNQGPSDAANVVVTDTLPPLLMFVSSVEGCTNGGSGQIVTCPTIATLPAGSSATFTLVVQLHSDYLTIGVGNGSDLQNTAQVTSSTTDPIPANNTSNTATPVIGAASSDVSIVKSVVELTVTPGGTLTYRLVVTNNGPSTALGVQVTDTLPAQVAFVSSPSFCNASGATVTCPPIGSLAVGATATFDIIVRLDPTYSSDGSDVVNTATVASTTPDPDGANNNDDASLATLVSDPSADVSIAKSVVESAVTPGQNFTYRLTVANAGLATAVNVAVTDTLPSQVTFVSSPEGCTAVGCPTILNLAPGVAQTFDLVVKLDELYTGTGVDVLNRAQAAAVTDDPDPTNNQDDITLAGIVTPPSANLTLTKMALEPSVTPGETFTYRITVGNTGPSTAANVMVTDTLPVPLAFQSSASGCTAVGQDVTCPPLGGLASGGTATFEVVVKLDPAYTGDGSDLGNVASATSPTDPTPVVTPPAPPPTVKSPSADVQIVKSVSAATVAPGDTYTYTLTITNHGPSNAVNVAVTDTLPTQTTFASSAAGCSAAGQSVTCPSIASMAVGASQAFDIVVQLDPSYVGDGSDVLNVAIALAQTGDPFLANNSSRLGAAPVGGPNADLAIVKDVSTDPVTAGTTFFYRLTVANQGPSTATNVVVADPLPVGVHFVSSPELCTAVGQDVTCPPIASLLPGQAATFVLMVQLDPSYGTSGPGDGSDIQNVASVTSAATDPVPGNNTSNPATPVIGTPNADVSITKSVVEPSVAPGGIFTYRLVVTNVGPSTALGVVVTDPLPAQVSFVSSPQGCTAAGQNVTCPPLGSLAVGASVTFDIRVLLDPLYAGDGSDVINIATSTSSTPDSVPGNGTSAPIALSVIPTGVDIAVTLAASPLNTVTGDIITLTATARNAGPDDATGLTVSLPLPIDLNAEGLTASVGSYEPTTGVWTIGALPAGTTATLQLSLRVIARSTPTLTATSTHVDQIERNPANDAATVALYLSGWSIPHADLVIQGTATPVVAAGAVLAFELHGINRGPAYVVDLFLSGAVPAGTTFAGVVPSTGGVCAAPPVGGTGTVTCTWPGVTFVDVGAQRTMTVGVRVDAGAAPGTSLAGSFLVSSLNPEYYLPSNLLTLTTSVADGSSGIADLALTAIMQSEGVTGTALALPLGVATPMRFTVRNNGPTPTAGATYAIEIPAEDLGYLQILGASVSQGAVGLTGISAAEWHVGPLAPGATATFDLSAAMHSMRATTIAMRRTGSAPADPNNANDRATLILDGTGHPDAGERFTAIGNINGVGTKEVLVGTGRLETPQVRIYDGTGADTGLHFLAYSRDFVGGVRLASCDVDADGIDEIITAPGIGPGPHVRVLRMQGNVVRELVGFYAFDPSFPGGVYVSCADVDNDGRSDVVVSMGEGGSEVRVFGVGLDFLTTKAAFTAYEPGFTGGARIAAVGTTEPGGTQYQIVTVSGPGRPLEMRTWVVGGGTASLVRSIPVSAEFQLGAFIDVADLNGDGSPEAVLATDRGIPALIGIMTLDTSQFLGIFQASPSTFLGGTRITLGDVDGNGRMELLVSQGYGGRPVVDAYTFNGGTATFALRLHPIEIP
jgi:uncharacterized repeat protein (TIGR01451 family)